MKFFIGQRVTGEDFNELMKEMEEIYLALDNAGHEYYCTLKEGEKFQNKSKKEMMNHAFSVIDKYDSFLAIVRNGEKSEGMLMEVGYCLAKNKKIILLIKSDVKDTYLRDIADITIEFKDKKDMITKLKMLRL
jgi:nucleoside 2-deoxyribosyltransferase